MSSPKIVEESRYGVYIWLVEGKPLGDGEGNFLSIASVKGDGKKIHNIRSVAHAILKENGYEPQGEPFFMSGRRKITDEEYQEQKTRQALGLVPDIYDAGALREELAFERQHGR
jgi:hypothetical protein